jgi:type I restriction enzyme S subunit
MFNLLIPLPPFSEQKAIAKVLKDFDELIEVIDKQIENFERIKKGLMQELLTKGIGHKEFKDTEIGRIPKEWEVLPAEKVCVKVTDGTHDTPKPSESGYYLITSKHLKDGKISFSDAYLISEDDFKEINKRSKVDVGDVLFSMIGTIGVTTVIEKDYPLFAIKNVGLFKTGGDLNLAYWLHYYFQSSYSANYIRSNLKGSTQKYIPLWALRKFPIAIPPYQERRKIIRILSKWDKVIELKKAKKEKLEKLKKKVMELLLTGKVRIR